MAEAAGAERATIMGLGRAAHGLGRIKNLKQRHAINTTTTIVSDCVKCRVITSLPCRTCWGCWWLHSGLLLESALKQDRERALGGKESRGCDEAQYRGGGTASWLGHLLDDA